MRRYQIVGADQAWSGWAWSGTAGFHVPSTFACRGADPGTSVPTCGIYRRDRLAWKDIAAKHLR